MIRHIRKHRLDFQNRKLRRNFYLVAANAFFSELSLFYPIAVLAFETVTGSFTLAMSVFAILGITQAIFEIPTGVMADKVGRRRTLIIGTTARFFAILCYFLSFSTPFGAAVLYIGAILYGFSNAMFSGNNDAMLYETLSFYRRPHEVSRLVGHVGSMVQLALALSGILASLCLWIGFSYRDLMMFSIAPVSISVLLSLFTLETPQYHKEEHPTAQHMRQALHLILKNPYLLRIALASAIQSGLNQSSHYFMPGFIETIWPKWLTPFYRTAQNSIGVVGFWFSGLIVKRLGAIKVLFVGTLVSNIVAFIAYVSASFISPILLITCQLFYATTCTADTSLQQASFSDTKRATMASLISCAGAIVGGLSSLLIGFLADTIGGAPSLMAVLVCSLLANLIYYRLYKMKA